MHVLDRGYRLARPDVESEDGRDVARRERIDYLPLEAHEYLDGLYLPLLLRVEQVDLVAVADGPREEPARADQSRRRVDHDVGHHHDHRAVLVAVEDGLTYRAVQVSLPDLGDAVLLRHVRRRVVLDDHAEQRLVEGQLLPSSCGRGIGVGGDDVLEGHVRGLEHAEVEAPLVLARAERDLRVLDLDLPDILVLGLRIGLDEAVEVLDDVEQPLLHLFRPQTELFD